MPYFRASTTLELWIHAADDQEADEKMTAVENAAINARPDVTVTIAAGDDPVEVRIEGWETSGPEYEPEIETR
jgi:hypothetical protein